MVKVKEDLVGAKSTPKKWTAQPKVDNEDTKPRNTWTAPHRTSNRIRFSGINPAETVKDQSELKTYADQFNKAKDKIIVNAAKNNPAVQTFTDPVEHIKEYGNAALNVAKSAAKILKGEEFSIEEPKSVTERNKKISEGWSEMGDALQKHIRKRVDIVKKKIKKLFNHPEWYGKFPEFISSNLNWGVRKDFTQFITAAGVRIPVVLTIPHKDGTVSRAYLDAMTSLFTKLRGSNSGAFNYVTEDVAAYVETTRSIRTVHAALVRDLKLLNNVDMYVSQTPDPILRIAGYNAAAVTDMRNNRALYVARLNQLAEIIDQTFPTFPDMAVYNRSIYLAKAILEEGKGPKSSVLVYTIQSVLAASGNNTNNVQQFTLAGNDFAQRLTFLENLISNARGYLSAQYPNADTFAKISGDMFKAYGQAALNLRCDRIDLSEKAAIVFDEYLLHQLQNSATCASFDSIDTTVAACPIFSRVEKVNVYIRGASGKKVTSKIVYGVVDNNLDYTPIVINTNKSDISGLEAISLTRGAQLVKVDTATVNCGANNSATLYASDGTIMLVPTAVFYNSSNTIAGQPILSFQDPTWMPEMIALWTQIDYMPPVQIFNNPGSGTTSTAFDLMEDIDTYAFMTKSQIDQFNDTAVLSLYKTVDVSDQVNFRSVKR